MLEEYVDRIIRDFSDSVGKIVPGAIIVTLRQGLDPSQTENILEGYNHRVLLPIPKGSEVPEEQEYFIRTYRVYVEPGQESEIIGELYANPFVKNAERITIGFGLEPLPVYA